MVLDVVCYRSPRRVRGKSESGVVSGARSDALITKHQQSPRRVNLSRYHQIRRRRLGTIELYQLHPVNNRSSVRREYWIGQAFGCSCSTWHRTKYPARPQVYRPTALHMGLCYHSNRISPSGAAVQCSLHTYI